MTKVHRYKRDCLSWFSLAASMCWMLGLTVMGIRYQLEVDQLKNKLHQQAQTNHAEIEEVKQVVDAKLEVTPEDVERSLEQRFDYLEALIESEILERKKNHGTIPPH